MIKAVLVLAGFGLLVVPLLTGHSVQQNEIPPCPPPAAESDYYPENMVRPRYPKDALRNGTAGTVDLRAVIAPDGKMTGLAVVSGDRDFSQSAETAIRNWRFQEVRHGQPVEAIYKIHIRFDPMLQEATSDVELESPPPEAPPTLTRARRQNLAPDVHHMSEPGMIAPKAIYSPEPEFSETARKAAWQGNVDIDLVVGPDGLPRDLQLVRSAEASLSDNALAAVKQWKFAPGTKDGKPVATEIQVEVSFKLYDR